MSITIASIIYDDRSGSTFLSSLLNEVPCIFVTLESSILTIMARHGRVFCSRNEVIGVLKVLNEEKKFKDWKYNESIQSDLLNSLSYPISATKFLEKLLVTIFPDSENCVNTVFVIKQIQVEYISLITEIFTELKFIMLYRDGRAVFASKKRSRHSMYHIPMAVNPVSAAKKWEGILNAKNRIGDVTNVFDIKYEDLLIRKYSLIEEIVEFLFGDKHAIDQQAVLLASKCNRNIYAQTIPASQRHLHQNIGKDAIVGRMDAWKHELSSMEIWLYERTVANRLKDYGYLLCNETAPGKIDLVFYSLRIKLREAAHIIKRKIIKAKSIMGSPYTALAILSNKIQK